MTLRALIAEPVEHVPLLGNDKKNLQFLSLEFLPGLLTGREKRSRPLQFFISHTFYDAFPNLYWDQKKLEEAEQVRRLSLERYEEVLGPDQKWTLHNLHSRADAFTCADRRVCGTPPWENDPKNFQLLRLEFLHSYDLQCQH